MNQSDDDHDVCTFDEDYDLYIKQGCAIIKPPGFIQLVAKPQIWIHDNIHHDASVLASSFTSAGEGIRRSVWPLKYVFFSAAILSCWLKIFRVNLVLTLMLI